MAPGIKSQWQQADFIYDFDWNAKIDDFFIDYLAFEARVGSFIWPNQIGNSLQEAIDAVNNNFEHEFTYPYGLSRLQLLEQRHKTFSWLLGLEDVNYVASTNVVTATVQTWKRILKADRFARAYLKKGEAKFEEISVIFAKPFRSDVIIVSSDDEEMLEQSTPVGKGFVLVNKDTYMAGSSVAPEDAIPNNPRSGVDDDMMAIVPYHNPEQAKPLEAIPPLDMVDISSQSSQTPIFAWWDQLDPMTDFEDSTSTDASTACSPSFAVLTPRGIRTGFSRYKTPMTPLKDKVRLSSTASNSPISKPPSM